MRSKLEFEIVPLAEVPMEFAILQDEKHQPSVLIVDDEKVIADTLSIILSKSGYAVRTAYNGTAALEMVKASAPELLISDVVMPGMTGIELAVALKSMVPDCKILLFSGQASTRDLLLQARDDGHDFLLMMKPIHPTDMLNRVRECLGARELVATQE